MSSLSYAANCFLALECSEDVLTFLTQFSVQSTNRESNADACSRQNAASLTLAAWMLQGQNDGSPLPTRESPVSPRLSQCRDYLRKPHRRSRLYCSRASTSEANGTAGSRGDLSPSQKRSAGCTSPLLPKSARSATLTVPSNENSPTTFPLDSAFVQIGMQIIHSSPTEFLTSSRGSRNIVSINLHINSWVLSKRERQRLSLPSLPPVTTYCTLSANKRTSLEDHSMKIKPMGPCGDTVGEWEDPRDLTVFELCSVRCKAVVSQLIRNSSCCHESHAKIFMLETFEQSPQITAHAYSINGKQISKQ